MIGDISGKSEYDVMMLKGTYNWAISNPKINLLPDSSNFTCDAKVLVGPFSYQSQVVGHVKISYDTKTNHIFIQITRAIFELYTMLLGSKVHIKDIHLEKYFKEPFVFDGPKGYTTNMSFTMPDSTVKKIYIQPSDCVMKVIKEAIITSCEILASNQPFKSDVTLMDPIQPTNKPKEVNAQK